MGKLVLDGKHINAGSIAKLEYENVVYNAEPKYSADAGTETEIDLTGYKGVLVIASDTMKYSLDGGNTYIDFEVKAGTLQYLNKTVGQSSVKVKNDNDGTSFVVMLGS